jgi:hypothetical protein
LRAGRGDDGGKQEEKQAGSKQDRSPGAEIKRMEVQGRSFADSRVNAAGYRLANQVMCW